nr:ribonuclease H-like domain-containing protein [Tanacetum cinerariifolium]
MDSLSPQVVSAAKLPILNPNEFDLWKMRIEQYFLMTDYSLWEVILNGDSPVPTRVVEDAKTLMKAIEKRFGGNIKTKKVQKTLLKQQFENFTGSSFEGLDQIHDRLQKLVSQLEIHGVSLSQEDVNLNTTDSVSAAASVSAVYAKLPASPLPNVDSLINAVIYSFFASQSTGLQLDNEDLKQIDVDGTGSYDWSYQAEEELVNYALMAFSSNSSSDNEVQSCSKACSKAYAKLHTQYDKLSDEFRKSQFDVISYQIVIVKIAPSSLYDMFQHSGTYHVVPPLITETFMPPKPDLVFNTAPTAIETGHHAFNVQLSPTKPEQDLSHITRPSPIETFILAATPAPASPKSTSSGKRRNKKTCFVCKSVDHLIKDCDYHAKKMAQPTQRNYAHRGNHKQYASLTHQKPQKHMVPTAVLTQSKPVFNIVVRPVSAVVPRIMGNPQYALKDKGVIDSGCSRHMTGNMSYLSDFEEFNGGYVSFGGNPKGGKIYGKGKIKTEHVPSGDLTCFFAKETIDESNLWHKRLAHINFKTINKLVKGNLARGLPIKVFKNDNTCVACKKGKQHRASCKTKYVSSVDQPLFRLHMDLFGPTFVKSLNKKSFCLVITDDYIRFTWVFFLATKDETSPILNTFITGLEN